MAEITKELGRVPISRGEFNLATTYYKDNIVQYQYASYQVTAESVTGVAPVSPEGVVNTGWIIFGGSVETDKINKVIDHGVLTDNWDEQDDDPEEYDPLAVVESSYAYNWKTTDASASDGKTEGNLKDLYQKNLDIDEKVIELEKKVGELNISASFDSSTSNQYVEFNSSIDIDIQSKCAIYIDSVTGAQGDNGWRIEAIVDGQSSYYTLENQSKISIKYADKIRIYLKANSGAGSLNATIIKSGLKQDIEDTVEYTSDNLIFNANIAKNGKTTTTAITLEEAISLAESSGLKNVARVLCYYSTEGGKIAIFNSQAFITGWNDVANWKVLDWGKDIETLSNTINSLESVLKSLPYKRTSQLYDNSNRDLYWKMKLRTGAMDFQSGINGMTICIEVNGKAGDTYSMAIIDSKSLAELGLQRNIVFACGNNKPANGVLYDQYTTEIVYTDKYAKIVLANNAKYIYLNLNATDDSSISSYEETLSKLVIVKSNIVPTEYINPVEFKVSEDDITQSLYDMIMQSENNAVKKQQGSFNRGKILIVGADGNVTLGERVETEGITNVITEENKVVYLGGNLASTDDKFTKGTSWSGNVSSGFVHSTGSNEPLAINLQLERGKSYLLLYDSNKKGESINEASSMRIDINEQIDIDPYDDSYSPKIGFVANSSSTQILFKAGANYGVTLSNIKVCEVTDSEHSVDSIVVETKNIDCGAMSSNITGFWNVALGAFDALNSNQSGSRNVAIGHSSLQHLKSGTRNIAVGTFAGMQLEQGERNIAIGADSLYQIKRGNDNISIGKASMGNKSDATDNDRNIAIGTQALLGNIEGTHDNIAIGFRSLASHPSYNNVAIGNQAGYWLKDSGNVVIGNKAQNNINVTGWDNVIIGAEAKAYVAGGTSENPKKINNTIAIGKGAITKVSNEIVIGNSSNSLDYVIIGNKKIKFNVDGTCTWENAN